MYFYITGKIVIIKSNSFILENNDIGYHIFFSNPYIFSLKQQIKIFTYFYVKENIQSLYGFLNEETLSFFEKLIKIPGIGPKIAIGLTNQTLFEETQKAIYENNISYLIKIPGIGMKTAKQIIFNLQNETIFDQKPIISNQKQKNVEEALANLGFKSKEIKKIISKINWEQKLETILKEALLLLTKY
ncbi:MAG: Holliday junction branch migration protein RuvA [Candidatus Phytoplasma stylosanthis]|nr:Holliday junction branch migration protein RuvA [Candidatus Phytoplasma stylosanthis]